jgi:hypothetical protein
MNTGTPPQQTYGGRSGVRRRYIGYGGKAPIMTGLRGTDRTALTPPSNSEQVRAYGPGSNKVAPNASRSSSPT